MTDPDTEGADADDRAYRWLIARERGEDTGHVPAAERAPYERLGALIGGGLAPRAGFRQRVLDAIDAAAPPPAPAIEPAAPVAAAPAIAPVAPATTAPPLTEAAVVSIEQRRRRRIWIAGGLAAAAAAAAAALLMIGGGEPVRPAPAPLLALTTEVHRGGAVVRADPERGEQASLGDTLVVRAEAAGPAEVRVYGGSTGRLLARCSDQGGCAVTRDGARRRFVLQVPLDTPGPVRAVVFAGARVPASTGALDPDLEAASTARIEIRTRPPTHVR